MDVNFIDWLSLQNVLERKQSERESLITTSNQHVSNVTDDVGIVLVHLIKSKCYFT